MQPNTISVSIKDKKSSEKKDNFGVKGVWVDPQCVIA
ncbi:uncharacterized protein SCODWIG_00883 [Saccharomycodes ludwigii]|uniref:Uncharacterized protein n=1 Tax=Saccharomycodes ludwigii TaxID=36035 RepID=A0A376B3D3_9ASCO|nr:hypothetical protein SCDLUD_004785 [Saccharomycodes ludwigii]KAH3899345.1 hypothetical protein SCDLUD_004785 [Saccharomycodes ludwigii]SSD59122.1 uncharacterized protein SCODWIG_00883 [Saccharomycodes ludwigii]